MKRMKKFLAVMLAAIMVMSMGTSVFAANDASILIKTTDTNRTYSAYLIFSGTYSSGTLTDIAWGSGVDTSKIDAADSTNLYTVLKADTTAISITIGTDNYTTVGGLFTALLSSNTAAEVANALSYASNDDALMVEFAKIIAGYVSAYATVELDNVDYDSTQGGYYAGNLANGYYLIVDTTDVSSATDDAASRYMLKVAGAAEIDTKEVVPTLTKYINSSDKTTTASIGDSVDYTLVSAVPDMTGYSTYTFTVTDTLSSGLTLDEATTGNEVSTYSASIVDYAISSNYNTSASSAGKALDLTITIGTTSLYGIRVTGESDEALSVASGATYSIVSAYDYYYYTSTDGSGNTTLTIVFYDFINCTETAGTAITISYSATLNSNAVIGDGDSNEGGNANSAYLTYSNNPNTGSETDTADTTKSTVSVFSFELDLTKVDVNDSSSTLQGAEFILYYTEGSNTYYAVVNSSSTVTSWTTDKDSASKITSDSNGKFTISGLGDGTYYLEETTAPTGYVVGSVLTVVISSDETTGSTTSGYTVDTLTATIGGDPVTTSASAGTITANITNSSSSALPTTGGIGTTIFYVAGMILALGAAVMLVTRRRMAR